MDEHGESNQKILLGITGGIAAYKSAELVRRLQNQSCTVKVVMTAAAEKFIGALTFQALTGEPVYHDMYQSSGDAMEHIELARWADKIIIAPASANFIAKLTHGLADDLLSTLCLAAEVPIYVAPAMNQAMWKNPATQNNISILQQRGIHFLGPDQGQQACGETGPGRLLDPQEIAAQLLTSQQSTQLTTGQRLAGKTVLITAGPTKEAIDPVRFISNHSSGKMAYALAQQALQAGANVKLISGPTSLTPPAKAELHAVESALQMHSAVMQNIQDTDIFIACAAVADYRPATVAANKIKKQADHLSIEMLRNPDILTEVCALKPKPLCIGFAAETENLLENAQKKLNAKNADLIIANAVGKNKEGVSLGFNAENNHAYIISKDHCIDLGSHSKNQLAHQLINHIAEVYEKKHTS